MYTVVCCPVFSWSFQVKQIPVHKPLKEQVYQIKKTQFLVIGRLQNWCGDAFFCLFFFDQPVKYAIHVYAVIETRPNFPYTKYGGWERPHKSGKRSYPYMKKSFNTQHSRIPIHPVILAAIGHRFIATKKWNQIKTKKADAPVSGNAWVSGNAKVPDDARGDQKPETLFYFLGFNATSLEQIESSMYVWFTNAPTQPPSSTLTRTPRVSSMGSFLLNSHEYKTKLTINVVVCPYPFGPWIYPLPTPKANLWCFCYP